MNLLNAIEKRHDAETAGKIAAIFNGLQLPIPLEKEYSRTNEGGYLTFLSPYGCVIRLTPCYYPLVDNPFVLRPLISIDAKKLRFDVNPGVHLPQTFSAAHKAAERVRTFNYMVTDVHEWNVGVLPVLKTKVLLDQPAIKKFDIETWNIKWLLDRKENKERARQRQLYGPLRKQFSNTLENTGHATIDPKAVQTLWESCQQAVRSGILVAGWKPECQKRKRKIKLSNYIEEKAIFPACNYKESLIKHHTQTLGITF